MKTGRPIVDRTGHRYGRLEVLERAPNKNGETANWRCRCDCGNTVVCRGSNLQGGTTQSCGCLLSESRRTRSRTHGMKNTPEWRAWSQARARCRDVNHQAYKWYGARGIRVCDRWNASFEAFYADMGPRPTPRHTLDRINTNGPYSPENCRWATWNQQQNNRRTNHTVTLNGETHTIAEWEHLKRMKRGRLHQRIAHGWSVERALTEPIHRRQR